MTIKTPPIALEEIPLPNWPFTPQGIAFGRGSRHQLEVLYSSHSSVPKPTQLRAAWKSRQDRRGVPLLVVVLHDGKAHVCGPSGEAPTVYSDLDAGQVERICQEALEQPSRQAALRSLRDSLSSVGEDGLPGLRNERFLASHQLANGVPNRSDWSEAKARAQPILSHTGKDLLKALGFTIEPLDNVTEVLTGGGRKSAVAILLNRDETPESGSQRIPGNLSPVSHALARADEEGLEWVVLIHGRKIRLYPVKADVGVGRRGQSETFLECHTGLIPDDLAGFLWLLFSAGALAENGTLHSILGDSRDFAGDLASRLRERVYDQVIPCLAEGLAEARGLEEPTAQELAETYQMAMVVLFRLLFIAYGEDQDLLPYRSNDLYQSRSLKTKAKELLNIGPDQFDESDSWWVEVQNLFKAVDKGNRDWGVPAYNGGLFSSDPAESRIGAALSEVSILNRVLGPALQHLLLVPTDEGVLGPVDFRSLGVREFGTIYEGLLESELSVAETDLSVESTGKKKGAYRPCKEGEEPVIAEGTIYLHNASGARKTTGSYYTKHFAVEHLLDSSLEPAIDDHFARLDELDELHAAESFFDFRVADIAMGSGHFLVAAVDHIGARFTSYLANRPLPQVAQEIAHLRAAAMKALGDAANPDEDFEDHRLLRRLIARRCIYGVDINEVAVQLARLGIWIHTFVPGLPLSLLDRNLIHGNSLVGIGQLSEFNGVLKDSGMSLFQMDAKTFLSDASDALGRLGQIADATTTEVKEARKAWRDADAAIEPTRALCDILTASRIEAVDFPILLTDWDKEKESVVKGKDHGHALGVLKELNPIHFPVAFPEVFLREQAGFDVILGNPPWEEARVEEKGFWARHFPGLRGLTQTERKTKIAQLSSARPDLAVAYEKERRLVAKTRAALRLGGFPGIGASDPEYYVAFLWRFWSLAGSTDGRIGVVLPRDAWVSMASAAVRKLIFDSGAHTDLTVLINRKGWVFPGVHEQNPVPVLSAIQSRATDGIGKLLISGPFRSHVEFQNGSDCASALRYEDLLQWSDTASVPVFPSLESLPVFLKLREAPRLDDQNSSDWFFRPYAELHSGSGQALMATAEQPEDDEYWPVYKGASIDLWVCDTGTHYGSINRDIAVSELQRKRLRGLTHKRSAFYRCDQAWASDPSTLPCQHPRIAFRDTTNRTNKRTVLCALVPPEVVLADQAPYLLRLRGDARDEAYLLGVLSSIPLDWYARRYVEKHIKLYIINPFPIPRPASDSVLANRVIDIAGRLAAVDHRFAEWAQAVGVECGPLEEEEKQDMIHELDAVVTQLYGLTEDHLTHIFETFHEGWDYNTRLDATLTHFRDWEKNA